MKKRRLKIKKPAIGSLLILTVVSMFAWLILSSPGSPVGNGATGENAQTMETAPPENGKFLSISDLLENAERLREYETTVRIEETIINGTTTLMSENNYAYLIEVGDNTGRILLVFWGNSENMAYDSGENVIVAGIVKHATWQENLPPYAGSPVVGYYIEAKGILFSTSVPIPGNLTFTMGVPKLGYHPAEDVDVTLEIKNEGENTITLEFTSSQVFDLDLGQQTWSEEWGFIDVWTTIALEPGESYSRVLTMPMPGVVKPGEVASGAEWEISVDENVESINITLGGSTLAVGLPYSENRPLLELTLFTE